MGTRHLCITGTCQVCISAMHDRRGLGSLTHDHGPLIYRRRSPDAGLVTDATHKMVDSTPASKDGGSPSIKKKSPGSASLQSRLLRLWPGGNGNQIGQDRSRRVLPSSSDCNFMTRLACSCKAREWGFGSVRPSWNTRQARKEGRKDESPGG
jgi:hypothetical protein